MANIDWGQIAGMVTGTVSNVFVPGSGPVVATLVDKGVDIGIDVAAKIKAGKEAGKTETQIANSLTPAEKASIVRAIDDHSKDYQEAHDAYLKLVTEGDKKVSTARKKAKITRTEVQYDRNTVAGIPRDQLRLFKDYPDMYTFSEFAQEQGTDLGQYQPPVNQGNEMEMEQHEQMQGGTGSAGSAGSVMADPVSRKRYFSMAWLIFALLLLYFAVFDPIGAAKKAKEERKRRTEKARKAKAEKAEMERKRRIRRK